MEIFRKMTGMGHEQVVFCHEPLSGLRAIIAIHSTRLGPALGGCRFWNYKSDEEALVDVLRLSRGMTYKAALAGLRLGGGKAVIIGDPKKDKSPELFKAFGKFIDSLGGRYITAEDVNIRVEDIEHVRSQTPYATGLPTGQGGSGDPSPVTAWGVYFGIKAAVRYKLNRSNLKGLTVAVQGLGSVGSHLCEYLAKEEVNLVVADIEDSSVRRIAEKYGARVSSPDKIHSEAVDIFAPCALGGIIHDGSLPEIRAKIVAGGANNQLLDEARHGLAIRKAGILYAPDYVINAGGLINVCQELKGYDRQAAISKAQEIYETLLRIFETADRENIPTQTASDRIAEDRISKEGGLFLQHSCQNQSWINFRNRAG
jgi:leucine dehydrogenase